MYIEKKIKSFQWMENRRTITAAESYNHGQKSWGTFAFMELFFSSYIKNTSLTPQTYVGGVCRDFFFRVSTLCRVGGWETSRKCRKRCTISWGNREITENYECHSTVLRTFVQDFSWGMVLLFVKLLSFPQVKFLIEFGPLLVQLV